MTRKLSYAVLTLAMAGGMAVSSAGAASAGHCVENNEPGFSYFGQEGREKDAPRGASACPASGNPSERAPGQQ